MHVLGTSGHVDHGKSTLVRVLTGIDPDRLREEQQRQMTIDLGFAWLTLPSGEEIGIVDVPGHRDFVENMLAGVGGFEAALLVVAADEGVRPQTREHVAILDLMEVPGLLVALSKIDLADGPEWRTLAMEEVASFLASTRFAGSSIIPVSAKTGEGIPELMSAIAALFGAMPPRKDLGRPRLAIDRVFSMSGFGTVVTGTLADGPLSVGEEVQLLPERKKARIRGLQTHRQSMGSAVPGSRVAVNLSGISVSEVRRGDVLVKEGTYDPTARADILVRAWKAGEESVENQEEMKLFAGTAQTLARTRLLGEDRIRPGESGWVQFDLARPMILARGDHVILRRPSPGTTVGGGWVAEPHPERRHRRGDAKILRQLAETLSQDPRDVFRERLRRAGVARVGDLGVLAGLDLSQSISVARELHASKNLIAWSGPVEPLGAASVVADVERYREWTESVLGELLRFHRERPLRRGMPRVEVLSRLKLETRWANLLLDAMAASGQLADGGAWLALAGHLPKLDDGQANALAQWNLKNQASPFAPPSWREGIQALGPELAAFYVDSGLGIQVTEDIVFGAEAYQEMVGRIKNELSARGSLTVAQVRDVLGASRKYALALLEHLDRLGVTRRDGDLRRLGPAGQGTSLA
ncbi:MAG: selenocysteine-specific translation elongation factor [Anaerolineales bacterium]